MTVASETSEVDYVGNGATTEFDVPFPFQLDAQLVVTLTPDGEAAEVLEITTDYTVEGAGEAEGTVTLLVAPEVDAALNIARTVAVTQTTNFPAQGTFSPAVHMRALDKLTMACQQLQRQVTALEARVAELEA